MASSNEDNPDFSQVKTARPRSVTPKCLRALGLMYIATEETTVARVPLSTSRGTDTDKNAGGSHTSASKELIRPHKKRFQSKSVAASSSAKKTSVVKKEYVSKLKDQANKRSHATSFDEPQSIPVVVAKKTRKPAAPPTSKPTSKKERQDVKKQQHKASPPVRKVSSSSPKSTVKAAENLSELTSPVDEVCFWGDILNGDFKLLNYTTLLKNNQFTEEQSQVIQKSFRYLYRTFLRRPTKRQCFMRTHECIECYFSISHECVSIDSPEYWTFGGNSPYIDFITPESTTMCLCNFTIFHSHCSKSNSKRESESPVRSPSPSTLPLVENNRSVNLECLDCHMKVSITNRNNDVCSQLTRFVSSDGPHKKFYKYVFQNSSYVKIPPCFLDSFYSCRNLCCMLYHPCIFYNKDVIIRNCMPIQPHRPLLRCHPTSS